MVCRGVVFLWVDVGIRAPPVRDEGEGARLRGREGGREKERWEVRKKNDDGDEEIGGKRKRERERRDVCAMNWEIARQRQNDKMKEYIQ